jgi:hypothetical protein
MGSPLKSEPKLKDMALVKDSRLSVRPVTAHEWGLLCIIGGDHWMLGGLLDHLGQLTLRNGALSGLFC